jgi:hypothetical protein
MIPQIDGKGNLLSGDNDFGIMISQYMNSVKVRANSVEIPDDFVKIDIYDDSELGQIALIDGLVMFYTKTDDAKKDTSVAKFYAIDGMRKIVYTCTVEFTNRK